MTPLIRAIVSRRAAWLPLLSLMMSSGAWADQWYTVTPTAVGVQNISNIAMVWVSTSQPLQNPAGCGANDSYFIGDPVLTSAVLGLITAAIVGGQSLQLYVSSTQCTASRPTVTSVQLL